jgi:hypothetical protein
MLGLFRAYLIVFQPDSIFKFPLIDEPLRVSKVSIQGKNGEHWYFICVQCGSCYFTSRFSDVQECESDFGLICWKCNTLNNVIAAEILDGCYYF